MLKYRYVAQFKKDWKTVQRAGKALEKLDIVMKALVEEVPLEPKLKDHALYHDRVGHRECHIEPDWLLIYRYEDGQVIFVRTGTHSQLFG